MKPLRLLAAAAALLIIGAAALLLALNLLEPDSYRDRLLTYLGTATGRSVAIDGELDISLSLRPALVAEGVRIGNAPWGTRADMITIERLEARVGILPLLFRGKVKLAAFTLIGTDVLLERGAAGTGNWEAAGAAAPRPDGGTVPRVDVRALTVKQASLTYLDAPAAEPYTVAITALTLAPLADGGLRMSAEAAVNERPLRLDGTTGALAGLTGGAPMPFSLAGDYGGFGAALNGTLQLLPAGRGIDLTVAGNTDTVSELSGRLQIALDGERPAISGRLRAGSLDISASRDAAGTAAGTAEGATAPLFTDEPLPLEALSALDVDIEISAGVLVTSTRRLTDFNAPIALTAGTLLAGPIEAAYGGGRINATIKLDAAAQLPELEASFDARGVELGQIDRLAELVSGAPARIDGALRGRGRTPAAMAASADGRLRIDVGAGTVISGQADLLAADLLMQSLSALNPDAGGQPRTELECAVINFPIRGGIASNDSGIAIQTSRFVVLGGGRMDLKTGQLDLALKPKAREGLGIGAASLASVVRVRGTLTAPKVGADALGVAAAGARVGAAIFTGGLSVLAEAALNKASSGNLAVCDVARGAVSLDDPAAGGAAATEDASPLDAARSAGSEAVESGRKLLKKLFD